MSSATLVRLSEMLVLAGVCKNVFSAIPNLRVSFEALVKAFPSEDCRAVFYENDSTDGTSEALLKWAKQDSRVMVTCEEIGRKHMLELTKVRTWDGIPCRMEMLALARNKVLRKLDLLAADTVVMMDLDVRYPLPTALLSEHISEVRSRPDVDALFCNGVGELANPYMYDAYAYRDAEFPFGPELLGEPWWHQEVPRIQRFIAPNRPWMPVMSAFNGVAIYRAAALRGLEYSPYPTPALHAWHKEVPQEHRCVQWYEQLKEQTEGSLFFDDWKYVNNSGYKYPIVCEHVTLHAEMRAKFGKDRMFVAPALLIPGYGCA